MASLHHSNSSESRLGSALTISVILHVIVAAFFAWPSSEIGFPGQLRATLVLGNQRGAEPGQGHVGLQAQEPQAAAGQSNNSSANDGLSGRQAAPASGQALAKGSPTVSGGGPNAGFFANATVLIESRIREDLQSDIFGDTTYLPVAEVAPKPRIADGLKLAYPPLSYGSPRRVTINVAIFLDESGKVVDAISLNEDEQDKVFADTALLALRNAIYQPGQRGGRPVRSKFLVTVRFGYE